MNTSGFKKNRSGSQMGIKTMNSGYLTGIKTNGFKNNLIMKPSTNQSDIRNHDTTLLETQPMVTGTKGESKTYKKSILERNHKKRGRN